MSSWVQIHFMLRDNRVGHLQPLYPGLRMGPAHILSSCITCQPTFPTFSTQKDVRMHFRTQAGKWVTLYVGVLKEITHPNLSVTHYWSILGFTIKDENCTQEKMTDSNVVSIFECKLGAKVTFTAEELRGHSQEVQQSLVAGLCVNRLPPPDPAPVSHHTALSNLEAGHQASYTRAGPGTLTSMTFAPCGGHTRPRTHTHAHPTEM